MAEVRVAVATNPVEGGVEAAAEEEGESKIARLTKTQNYRKEVTKMKTNKIQPRRRRLNLKKSQQKRNLITGVKVENPTKRITSPSRSWSRKRSRMRRKKHHPLEPVEATRRIETRETGIKSPKINLAIRIRTIPKSLRKR